MIKLYIESQFKNLFIHTVKNNMIWASRSYTLFESPDCGAVWYKRISLPVSLTKKLISKFEILSRLFRTGIQNIVLLPSGNLLIIADGVFYRFEFKSNELKKVHKLRYGRRPLKSGICIDKNQNIYYGEYWLNPDRKEVKIYKSMDDGITWQPVFTFKRGSIRHIHGLQYDPFTGWIWIATGDLDHECKIGFSEDEGLNFNYIGYGSELWRAVTLIFTEKYVFWATDGEREQNYICRWKRPNGPVEKLFSINGPVYNAIYLKNRSILFATGVEKALTEWDNYCRIWGSIDDRDWQEIIKWEKDVWPPIFGYGTVFFATGQDKEDYFYFTAQALKNIHGYSFKAQIKK